MKKILLTILTNILFIGTLFAQDIDSLTYNMTQDLEIAQKFGWFKPTEIKTYVDSKGNKIKAGDTLFVGSPSSSASYSVGGTISSNNSSAPGVMTKNAGIYMYLKTGEYMNNTGAGILNSEIGSIIIVSQIGARHVRNSKNSPLDIFVVAKSVRAAKFMGNDRRIITNIEKAFEVGEVYLKNRKMTKSEAMTVIKEKKELLDLGVITKEEFDKIKKELTPILLEK